MRLSGGKKNNNMNKYTLYKINNSEPIEIRVSTSPKIDGFVHAFIRGKTNNNMIKYTLLKINNTEPILILVKTSLKRLCKRVYQGSKKNNMNKYILIYKINTSAAI